MKLLREKQIVSMMNIVLHKYVLRLPGLGVVMFFSTAGPSPRRFLADKDRV